MGCAASRKLYDETRIDVAKPEAFPVAPGSGDEVYLSTVREALKTCTAFKHDLILYQAGVDGLEADALGKLNVSRDGMRQRNHLVFEAARDVPLVVFMGGGYAKPIDASLDAFFDLFSDAATWNQTD